MILSQTLQFCKKNAAKLEKLMTKLQNNLILEA